MNSIDYCEFSIKLKYLMGAIFQVESYNSVKIKKANDINDF